MIYHTWNKHFISKAIYYLWPKNYKTNFAWKALFNWWHSYLKNNWYDVFMDYMEKTTDLSQVTDKLYHIMLYTSPWTSFELTTSVVIGTDCICSCKNYKTNFAWKALFNWWHSYLKNNWYDVFIFCNFENKN
jgi:hypothetical protein